MTIQLKFPSHITVDYLRHNSVPCSLNRALSAVIRGRLVVAYDDKDVPPYRTHGTFGFLASVELTANGEEVYRIITSSGESDVTLPFQRIELVPQLFCPEVLYRGHEGMLTGRLVGMVSHDGKVSCRVVPTPCIDDDREDNDVGLAPNHLAFSDNITLGLDR